MAVRVTVYGTADMRQITRAREELDRLEKKAMSSAGGFTGAMARFSNSAQKAGEAMQSAGASMTRSLTVPLVAVGFALNKATENAAKDAQAQVILAGALRNNAGATDAVVKSTEAWITKQGELLGVSDDALRPALATLVGATKDVGKAQTLAGLAMDIAAARGVDVETASKALAKAYAGQTSQLTKLVPGIDQAAVKSKNFGAIMQSVSGIVGGQAAAAANTEAGARQRANVAMDEAVESLGYAFMPMMTQVTKMITTQVVPTIQKFADWFGRLDKGTQGFILNAGLMLAVLGPLVSVLGTVTSGIGAFAGGIAKMSSFAITGIGQIRNMVIVLTQAQGAAFAAETAGGRFALAIKGAATATWGFVTSLWAKISAGAASAATWVAETAATVASTVAKGAATAATWAMSAAQWALNAAMNANPIVLIVTLIAGLVAGLVWLWNTNEGFRNALTTAWNAIAATAGAVWNGIVGTVQWVGQTLMNWVKNFSLPGLLIKAFMSISDAVRKNWDKIVAFFQQAPGRIISALGDIGGKMLQVGKQIVDGLLDGIKNGWSAVTNWLGNAVNNVVDSVKSALGIHSPSRVFVDIGLNTTKGFAKGIRQGTTEAVTAAQSLANQVAGVSPDTATLSGKKAPALEQNALFLRDVQKSGTKVTKEMARQQAQTLRQFQKGIKGTGDVNKNSMTLAQSLAAGTKSPSDTTWTNPNTPSTPRNAGPTVAEIAKGFMQAWGAGEMASMDTKVTAASMLAGVTSQAQAMGTFVNNISKLRQGGLNKSVVNALLAAGPAQSGSQVAALASMSPEQIKAYNAQQAQEQRFANILADMKKNPGKTQHVNIAAGAVQVTVGAGAQTEDVSAALDQSIEKLVKELRAN